MPILQRHSFCPVHGQDPDPSSFWSGEKCSRKSFVLPADLSSYTPKHSVKFSEWQEQKYEEMPASERPLPKEADSHGNQVMVRLQSRLWLCPVPLLSGSWISLGSGWDRTCLPLNTCVAHLAGQGKQRSTQASTAPSSPASPCV